MRTYVAFVKKELLECSRSGRMLFLLITFVLIGIMNPAVAKLTPWLMEMMSETLAQSGMTITAVEVSAFDSWVQFFKNIPIALIVFVLSFSGIFTREYSSGALILLLTKGVSRYKILLSKLFVLLSLWTVGYFGCFAITYAYNAYFWDNSTVQNVLPAVMLWFAFGIFILSVLLFFSILTSSNTGVLIGVLGAVLLSYALSMIPKVKDLLPTTLLDSNRLISGVSAPDEYLTALAVTVMISLTLIIVSIPLFNKKQI